MSQEIISKFRERPKTKTTWRAMYLGLATLFVPPFLGIFAAVIRPMIDRASVNNENVSMSMGFGGVILALVFSISALVTGIKAYRKGERSWVLWAGLIPSSLIGAFWIVMIIGELVFPH